MNIDLENELKELSSLTDADFDLDNMDPIAKMMLVATLYETDKIFRKVEEVPQRVMERYCTHFIPSEKIAAMPAITLLNPQPRNMEMVMVDEQTQFTYKVEKRKTPIGFIPIIRTLLLPHDRLLLHVGEANTLHVGIVTKAKVETLKGLSIMIRGSRIVPPDCIRVGKERQELTFASFWQIHRLDMLEPFDAQQSNGKMFDMVEMWKREILNIDDITMLYITDKNKDRDLFKPTPLPPGVNMESMGTNAGHLDPDTLWLCLEFPQGLDLSNCQVCINVLPVTNVEVRSISLSKIQPIAKLLVQEDTFLLDVLKSNSSKKKAYDIRNEEFLIRDFDSMRYNNEELYRDVQNLYNRFIDDYYAFIDYNDVVNETAELNQLRTIIDSLYRKKINKRGGKSFNNGTYVMSNIAKKDGSSNIEVNYIITHGEKGNLPDKGQSMECKNHPGVAKDAPVLTKARGGANKASTGKLNEWLRYFTLTGDRLYTKMDVDAFLRTQIMNYFGESEFDRINIKIDIKGMGADTNVKRAMYVNLEFKDKENYDKALKEGFKKHIEQNIEARACIPMPIIIKLVNLEK